MDALGYQTDFTYNLAGQTDTTTYPATGQTGTGRSRTTNGYLYVGGPLTTATAFDESNVQVRQVTRTYGVEGEALSVSGSTEPVTNTYDALYRVKTLTDGNNNTTTYSYNNIGLVSSILLPGGDTTQFPSYDNDGNLLQRIDGNSVVTNYLYTDSESRLTDIQYPASSSLNVHFGYDSYGRRSSMTDASGSRSYSYGNLDELSSTTTTYTGLAGKTISYVYYPDGSRQTMTTPAGTFSYYYDAARRPSSITNPFSETTNWTYQNNDWLSTQTLANGATATYTHNAVGQVTRLLNQIGSNTISDFSSLVYDGVGNRTSVTASIPGATSLNGTTGYTYDTKDQVTQETSTRNGGFTDNFGYDSAGNPTTFKGATKNYNSKNQQTGTGFSYDGNGNPTTYNTLSLTFDPENGVTAFVSIVTASYKGNGLRAWKQNATGRTYFLYDGINPIVELDASGAVNATSTIGSAGLVSRRTASSIFYSFDAEGNVAQRSDAGGNIVSNYLFAAHGTVLSSGLSDPYGYKGRFGYFTDGETGLQLLGHRYYDPSTGRFLTRDPIGYAGGVNLYSYVRNNPSKWIDPIGHDIFGVSVGGSAYAGYGPMGGGVGAAGSTVYGYNTTDGEVGTASSYGYFYPGSECEGYAIGSSGSVGLSFVYSNANKWDDLGGDFDTHEYSAGPVSVEISYGANGLFQVQVSPGTSLGKGAGYANFKSYTPPGTIGSVQGLGRSLAEEIDRLYGGGYCGCR
ncbi:MAG TPA: RHS repeat-associated core domain-containing protein [Pyrinomonadaceae bacterium]